MGTFQNISRNFEKKMKIFSLLAVAVFAQLEYDDLGNKKNGGKEVDKGPRWCANKATKLEDSADGSRLWKCRSRNPSNKNPHLTKRCKLKCKKGTKRSGISKVWCKNGHYRTLKKMTQPLHLVHVSQK